MRIEPRVEARAEPEPGERRIADGELRGCALVHVVVVDDRLGQAVAERGAGSERSVRCDQHGHAVDGGQRVRTVADLRALRIGARRARPQRARERAERQERKCASHASAVRARGAARASHRLIVARRRELPTDCARGAVACGVRARAQAITASTPRVGAPVPSGACGVRLNEAQSRSGACLKWPRCAPGRRQRVRVGPDNTRDPALLSGARRLPERGVLVLANSHPRDLNSFQGPAIALESPRAV